MPNKPWWDLGNTSTGPQSNQMRPPNSRTNRAQLKDLNFRFNPRVICDEFDEFMGVGSSQDVFIPTLGPTGLNVVPTTGTSIGQIRAPVSGVITAAQLITETSLAIDGTNYVRITAQNLGSAGALSTVIAASATTVNTTFTGGAAIVANVPYPITLSATAGNLNVAAGDIIQFTITVTGTLGAVLDAPIFDVTIATAASAGSASRVAHGTSTGTPPAVTILANTANGILQAALSATSEAQTAGRDWKDQLLIPSNKTPFFECFVQIPVAIAANQVFVAGLASAFNATLTSTTLYAWFRLNGSMVVLVETSDGSSVQSFNTGVTLNAAQNYRLAVDMHDLGVVRFFIEDNDVGLPGATPGNKVGFGINALPFNTVSPNLLQPVVYVQKASGVTTPSFQMDWWRQVWSRL